MPYTESMEENSKIIATMDSAELSIPDKLEVPYTRRATINSIAISVATFAFVSCLPMLSGREIPVEYRIILGGLFSIVFVFMILHKTKQRQNEYDTQQVDYAEFIGNVRTAVGTNANQSLTDDDMSKLSEGETISFVDGIKVWMTKDKESASLFMGTTVPAAT